MPQMMVSSPHIHKKRTTAQVMQWVILCCIPGIAVQTCFFGWGTLIHVALACIVAIVAEASILELRKKNIELALSDYSAVVTALLLAISIPPFAPWWITVIGVSFAIIIVKQLYGGLGYNLFNPAMAGYVALLISFPVQMTAWSPPTMIAQEERDFFDALAIIFTNYSVEGFSVSQMRIGIDGYTMATPLDHVRTALSQNMTYSESITGSAFSNGWGIGWTWVNLSYLLGGLILLQQRIIAWHIPVSILLSLSAFSCIFFMIDPDHYAPPTFHLLAGGTMLAAFFIATDPVSAATSNKGRLIFGAFIGFWIFAIRTWGGYPDAVAFAVLLMNMAVPVIDYFTKPITYGHKNKQAGQKS